MNRPGVFFFILVILIIISLPFLLAAIRGGDDYVFVGFLINPVDGASYLAKMYQGWSGSWKFTLPYTAETGNGAYLFLFYLFLGHLARWTQLPLTWVFHLARLSGSALLLFSLAWYFSKLFHGRIDLFWKALLITSLGSGMGWLVVFTGRIPFDMWVAEAYPFLSMYSNPHFPLGLALLVFSMAILDDENNLWRNSKLIAAGLFISILYPFGLIVSLVLACGWMVWKWVETKCLDWQAVISLGVAGGPLLLYQFIATQADPLLSGWNVQNITLTPAAWDIFISLSPAVVLAVVGWIVLIRTKGWSKHRIILLWPILELLLMYFPFSLQRRFSLGIYIPLVILAVIGLDWVSQKSKNWGKITFVLLLALSLPTNLLLVFSGMVASSTYPKQLYLSRDEYKTLQWIETNLPRESVILASPDMSLLIPAFTGRRVVYGHPYETVNANIEKHKVLTFYEQEGWIDPGNPLFQNEKVKFFFFGAREIDLSKTKGPSFISPVYQSGEVRLYSVDGIK